MSKDYIPRKEIGQYLLERVPGGLIFFYVYEKYTGPQALREYNANILVKEILDAMPAPNVKKNWYSMEKAREVWREKRLWGWQTPEEMDVSIAAGKEWYDEDERKHVKWIR